MYLMLQLLRFDYPQSFWHMIIQLQFSVSFFPADFHSAARCNHRAGGRFQIPGNRPDADRLISRFCRAYTQNHGRQFIQ